jgi:hypothetical protein
MNLIVLHMWRVCKTEAAITKQARQPSNHLLLVSVPAPESQTPCKRCKRIAGATELECGASVTGQSSNQRNYSFGV